MELAPFLNRLQKTAKHRAKWAKREGLSAYRIYDQDIPEHRYAVDAYADFRVIYMYGSKARGGLTPMDPGPLRDAVSDALEMSPEKVVVKERNPHAWRQTQYEKLDQVGRTTVVEEAGLRFEVNLSDYIDTGLFLDHRITRQWVKKRVQGKRVLNLFCYTGSFTVHAAAGGAAQTTSVDLSNTYLDWANRNLELNGLADPKRHRLIRSDATRWLEQTKETNFDLIVLDPPSFSVSKKMQGTFNVQRDHPELIKAALSLLDPRGELLFSTNYRDFGLDMAALGGFQVDEMTPGTIPEDFRDKRIHRAFLIR
jgi:23S rRNA (cytosine1962-C5)-methyltransferase